MRKHENLKSFKSSKSTTQTFCGVCGSGIAWARKGYERIYLLVGTLDGTIQIEGGKHIFTEDRGKYYKVLL
jgi:hypothetical protein